MPKAGCHLCEMSTPGLGCVNHPKTKKQKAASAFADLVESMDTRRNVCGLCYELSDNCICGLDEK